MMRAVRRRGTRPELAVQELVRALGFHYRLNNKSLPGSPDLSNKRGGWVIFVHGCFWHGHRHCKKTKGGRDGRVPASRAAFWADKLATNRARDRRNARQLRAMGFRVLTVWECELRDLDGTRGRLARFLRQR